MIFCHFINDVKNFLFYWLVYLKSKQYMTWRPYCFSVKLLIFEVLLVLKFLLWICLEIFASNEYFLILFKRINNLKNLILNVWKLFSSLQSKIVVIKQIMYRNNGAISLSRTVKSDGKREKIIKFCRRIGLYRIGLFCVLIGFIYHSIDTTISYLKYETLFDLKSESVSYFK